MGYESYRVLYIVSSALCGLFFLISIFLFIYFRIPAIIGEITGVSARRAIKKIGYSQINAKNRMQLSSRLSKSRQSGKITNTDKTREPLTAENTNYNQFRQNITYDDERTELLDQTEYNTLADENKTELLYAPSIDTDMTELLEPKSAIAQLSNMADQDEQLYIIEEDITFIHIDADINK